MYFKDFFKKNRKGVMGLELLLSVISSIFIIGIIVMCFILMTSEIGDTNVLYSEDYTASASNESLATVLLGVPRNLTNRNLRNVECTLGVVYNGTAGVVIGAGNYSEVAECQINCTDDEFNGTTWLVNYDYTFDSLRTEAEIVLNDTSDAMGESPTFFSIIIIIASVVVLILLIVVILKSLKGSGLMGSGGA